HSVERFVANSSLNTQGRIEPGLRGLDVQLGGFELQLGLFHVRAVVKQLRRHPSLDHILERFFEFLRVSFDRLWKSTHEKIDSICSQDSLLLLIVFEASVFEHLSFKTLNSQLRHASGNLLQFDNLKSILLDGDIAVQYFKSIVEGDEFIVGVGDLSYELSHHEASAFNTRQIAILCCSGRVSELLPDIDFPGSAQTEGEVRQVLWHSVRFIADTLAGAVSDLFNANTRAGIQTRHDFTLL